MNKTRNKQLNGQILQISAGGGHTCAYNGVDHLIYCWGLNKNGQTTVPAVVNNMAARILNTDPDRPIIPNSATSFKGLHVKNGLRHSCLLAVFDYAQMKDMLPANNLICWGWNRYSQSTLPDELQRKIVIHSFDLGQRHSCG